MNYRALKNHWIDVAGEVEFSAGPNGSILIPPSGTKVFLHWTNENGKLISTHTLTYATLVHNRLRLISKPPVRIQVIEL
jgi:hypothetical protein